jgi:cobalamin biosynthetic protein CobC
MLEHGGNLREAMHRFGGADWIDLSTGINPVGYPVPALPADAWHRLPEPDVELVRTACGYYGAPSMLPVAGTQAAIQALPRLRTPGRVVVASPTYAEHIQHWHRHGHSMRQVPFAQLDASVREADVVVVCNPNNPTGDTVSPATLLRWADELAKRGGWLVVDEAFGDTCRELSVASASGRSGLIVLRSVGKFFGLAGLRLGFVGAQESLLDELSDLLGPWAVSGPAQRITRQALADSDWQQRTQARLAADGARMRELLAAHGIGATGTALFHWWPEAKPEEFHVHMARRAIWVRLFREGARGIRLGLPAQDAHWQRLEQALHEWNNR